MKLSLRPRFTRPLFMLSTLSALAFSVVAGCGDSSSGDGTSDGGDGDGDGEGDGGAEGDGDGSPATFCTSDKDCTASGGVCDTALSRCVECLSQADCSDDELCQKSACVSVTSCQSSKDCGADEVCGDLLGYCVQCEAETDCAAGEVCLENACTLSCASDKDCRDVDGVCSLAYGACVDCAADADCGDDEYCDATGSCVSQICNPSDTFCSGDSLTTCNAQGSGFGSQICSGGCDEDAGECGACEGDEGCSCYANDTCNDELSCFSGFCVDPNNTGSGGGANGSGGQGNGTGGAPDGCGTLDASTTSLVFSDGDCLVAAVDIYYCVMFANAGACLFTIDGETRLDLTDTDGPQGSVYRSQGDCVIDSCAAAESCCEWNAETKDWDGCEGGCD